MYSHTVDSLPNFLSTIEKIESGAKFHLYRGQTHERNLVPGIARIDPTLNTSRLERKLLEQFGLLGTSMLPPGPLTDLDLMVIAQHFGLRTRLLDWSANPLVALYFACSSRREGDAFVYVLWAQGLIAQDAYAKNPFIYPEIQVIQPRLNNARVAAQDGWFTVHPYLPAEHRFASVELDVVAESVDELVIPAAARKSILASVHKLGITSRSMFPDLGGLSEYLNDELLSTEAIVRGSVIQAWM